MNNGRLLTLDKYVPCSLTTDIWETSCLGLAFLLLYLKLTRDRPRARPPTAAGPSVALERIGGLFIVFATC